jgi:DNA (cytosine-5)-methyltransferase 1
MTIRCLDLFSGVGGFRLATERASRKTGKKIEFIGFSEIDQFAIKTYKNNFEIKDQEVQIGDVWNLFEFEGQRINVKKSHKKIKTYLPDFDILFAGFPCQSFSIMGTGGWLNDERGFLFYSIGHILKAKKPSFFILENVKGLYSHNHGKTFKLMLKKLRRLGYSVTVWILNSKDYGVPQTRRRVYILGSIDKSICDKLVEPDKINLNYTKNPSIWHLLNSEVEEKYYLSKKMLATILKDGSGKYKSKSEINPLIAKPLTATMHKMHRANQDNYYSNQFITGKYDQKSKKVILNKKIRKLVRRITPEEAFKLQGFPENFVKNARLAGISDTQLYRQAGNAITTNTAEAVIQRIFETGYSPN